MTYYYNDLRNFASPSSLQTTKFSFRRDGKSSFHYKSFKLLRIDFKKSSSFKGDQKRKQHPKQIEKQHSKQEF